MVIDKALFYILGKSIEKWQKCRKVLPNGKMRCIIIDKERLKEK